MNELISVIVPIYNISKYLPKCIDSIINQSYKNLEIILVDDGSTDGSENICDTYQLKDNRIVVIHKENSGLSSARNSGIEVASGRLISFVDGDDYIEKTFIEDLKNNMDINKSDISVCNYFNVKNNIKTLYIDKNEEFWVQGKDKFNNIENNYRVMTIYSWNKLYKKSLFERTRYANGLVYEDAHIICDLLDTANKVSYTFKPLYNYVYRQNSISNTFNLKSFDKVEAFNRIINAFEKKGYHDLTIKEKNRKISLIIYLLAKMKEYNFYDKDTYEKYYKDLHTTCESLSFNESNKSTLLFKVLGNNYFWLRYNRFTKYFIKKV